MTTNQAIILTLVNVTDPTRLYGDRIEREQVEIIYIFCFVEINGGGEFFSLVFVLYRHK